MRVLHSAFDNLSKYSLNSISVDVDNGWSMGTIFASTLLKHSVLGHYLNESSF